MLQRYFFLVDDVPCDVTERREHYLGELASPFLKIYGNIGAGDRVYDSFLCIVFVEFRRKLSVEIYSELNAAMLL